jgi:acyl-homoserine-lactone acylase
MRFVKIGAVALALILIGTAAFLIMSDRLAQPAPPDPASLIAKAVQYHVRIERDHFGVPHIIGTRDAGVD